MLINIKNGGVKFILQMITLLKNYNPTLLTF